MCIAVPGHLLLHLSDTHPTHILYTTQVVHHLGRSHHPIAASPCRSLRSVSSLQVLLIPDHRTGHASCSTMIILLYSDPIPVSMEGATATIHTRTLSDVLSVASVVGDDFDVRGTPDGGWDMTMISVSHTSMMSVEVPPEGFISPPTGPASFSVRCVDMEAALKGMGDPVTVDIRRGVVQVTDGHLTRRLPSADPSETRHIPEFEAHAWFRMPSKTARQVTSDLYRGVAFVTFAVDPEGVTMSALDDAGMGTELRVPAGDLEGLAADGTVKGTFDAKLIDAYLKALGPEHPLDMSMSTDYPATMSFGPAEGVWAGRWVVAPVIVEE